MCTKPFAPKHVDIRGACMGMEQGRACLNNILIIDDDAINREILTNIFSPFYSIEEAENGKAGLEKLLARKDDICAVLLDFVMPEMNGLEVLRFLHDAELTRQIPVFLITAESSNPVMKEAYELGVMDVIGKPITPYIVIRRVQSVVELFQARRLLSGTVEQQQAELLVKAQQIIELNQGMLEALATAIEFRNGESGEHVRRIHDITKFIFENTELGEGLTLEDIEHIALASAMHDVGKIAIPDAILTKPGKLTFEEYEVMKTHSAQGALLLEKIPQLRGHPVYKYAHDIARHHHERWDGKGYPDGLKGDECSTWSQVVALVDVYDALISKRVYKDSFTPERALSMIADGQCGVFNPRLLKIFFAVEPEIRRTLTSECAH